MHPPDRTMQRTTPYVPETAFGKWFLRTKTWEIHVLDRALDDLERLLPGKRDEYRVVMDVGCGCGRSLPKLHARFKPELVIGVDFDRDMLAQARRECQHISSNAQLIECSSSRLPMADASVDLLFCHQTFHHLVDQTQALEEFRRVLKPGGVLLFAESTRRYIHSWIIRLLFRHPMHLQRSAPEYLQMLRDAGFVVEPRSISYPYLWWSRGDLGVLERWFGIRPPEDREETLINLIATRPA